MKKFLCFMLVLIIAVPLYAEIDDAKFIRLYDEDDAESIQEALNEGANPNAKRESDGVTILMRMSERNTHPDAISLLIKAGADVNMTDDDGDTALMYASSRNTLEVVKVLLENGADLNIKGINGETALHAGAMNKNPEIAAELIRRGADVNAKAKGGVTPLLAASTNGKSPEVIDILVMAGADINARAERDNMTALIASVRSGNSPEILNALIKAGIDINAKDSNGKTAIDYTTEGTIRMKPDLFALLYEAGADPSSVSRENITSMLWEVILDDKRNNNTLSALIKAGADVNKPYKDDRLMIEEAVNEGNLELIELLIKTGADVNAKLDTGSRVLMLAKTPEIAEILLRAGADVNAYDSRGRTAFDIALSKGDTRLIELFAKSGFDINKKDESGWTVLLNALRSEMKPAVIEALIKSGADVNVSAANSSALVMALRFDGKREIIEMLLNAGANPNWTDKEGYTPVFNSLSKPELLSLLISAGANLNVQDTRTGTTPLMLAVSGTREETILVLLNAGADTSIKNNRGQTALDLARKNKKLNGTEALKRLEELSR